MKDMTTSEYYVLKKGSRRYLRKLFVITKELFTLDGLMYKIMVAYDRLKDIQHEQKSYTESWLDDCPDDPLSEAKRELWLTVLAAAETVRKVTGSHGLVGNLFRAWLNLKNYWICLQNAYEAMKSNSEADAKKRDI